LQFKQNRKKQKVKDLPLILKYNVDPGSFKAGGRRFGYFCGRDMANHCNHYTAAKTYHTTRQQVKGFEPVVNAAIRFYIKRYRIINMELKISYMKMMEKSRPDIFGIGYIINF
jgi:hypothetical protein